MATVKPREIIVASLCEFKSVFDEGVFSGVLVSWDSKSIDSGDSFKTVLL